MKSKFLSAINPSLIVAGTAYAANSLGRLNVEGTQAGPGDYAMYVGGPAAAAILAALYRLVKGYFNQEFPAVAGSEPGPHFSTVGKEIGKLCQGGRFDAAQALLDALRGK